VASSLITAWIEDAWIGCGALLISFDVCVVSMVSLISTFQRESGRERRIPSLIAVSTACLAFGVLLLLGWINDDLLLSNWYVIATCASVFADEEGDARV
jgi:protein-S-isoprenylcysteine O-methyltransferase Ste14